MKITLDIPNEHAPRLLAMLSDLMPVRLEPQADPAEGHPELPLDDESEAIAETRWAPIEGIDAADPLKVEMEAEFISPPQSFETASTVPPVVGERFYTRNGGVVKFLECNVSPLHPQGQYKASFAGSYEYYDNNGKAGAGPHFDIVQHCPF